MSSSPGQCICASNQYISQSYPLVCKNCHSACSTCSGPLPTDCTSCLDSSSTLSSSPGYCSCEDTKYIVSKSPFVCGDCNEKCYSCSGWGENNCLTCKNSEITPSSDGFCKCKDNEYIISKTNLQCGACDSSCSSCVGPGPEQCLTCKDSSVALKVQPSSCSGSANASSSQSGKNVKGLSKVGGFLVSGGLIAAGFFISVIEGKTGTLWTYVNIVQLLAFIPLQNIEIPDNLYEFWKAFLSYAMVPSLGKLFYGNDGADDAKPYSNWQKYGYKGSSFLVNGGAMLLIALIVTVLWITVYSLKFYKKEKIQKIRIPLLSKFECNAFIRLWLEIYILLIAANIIGINNLLFTSPSAVIDSLLSLFTLALSIFLQILFFIIIYTNRFKIYKTSKKITAKYGSLFEEFKFNNRYIELLYYPFFLLRRFILVINLYNSSRIPLLQWIINLCHSIATVLYLFKYCHFKEKETHLVNFWGEILVAVSFLLTGPYIYDISSIIDTLIQITVISLTFSYLVFSYYFLMVKIYAAIKAKLGKKTKIIVIPETIAINPNGPEFNDFHIRVSQSDLLSQGYCSNETILSQRDEQKVIDLEHI